MFIVYNAVMYSPIANGSEVDPMELLDPDVNRLMDLLGEVHGLVSFKLKADAMRCRFREQGNRGEIFAAIQAAFDQAYEQREEDSQFFPHERPQLEIRSQVGVHNGKYPVIEVSMSEDMMPAGNIPSGDALNSSQVLLKEALQRVNGIRTATMSSPSCLRVGFEPRGDESVMEAATRIRKQLVDDVFRASLATADNREVMLRSYLSKWDLFFPHLHKQATVEEPIVLRLGFTLLEPGYMPQHLYQSQQTVVAPLTTGAVR